MSDPMSADPDPNDLYGLLDAIVDDIRKEHPGISDLEAAFGAIRVNLVVVIQNMAEIGSAGYGLSNEVLYRITEMLVMTCQWMTSKEAAYLGIPHIENEINK